MLIMLAFALSGMWATAQYYVTMFTVDTVEQRMERVSECISLEFDNRLCVNNLPTQDQLNGLRLCVNDGRLSRDECSSIVFGTEIH